MKGKMEYKDDGRWTLVIGIFLCSLFLFLLDEGKNSFLNAAPILTTNVISSPPESQIYHAVYPGHKNGTGEEDDLTSEDLSSYEETVGKSVAWVYFSRNWYRDRNFPLETASWIRESGSIPFIRLMLRDTPVQYKRNRNFTLKRILKGMFDEDLRVWAREARDFDSPLIVEFGAEVNREWFPWNGKWNGGRKKKEYGDPTYPDGPERFRV